jgi:hypothetical protein
LPAGVSSVFVGGSTLKVPFLFECSLRDQKLEKYLPLLKEKEKRPGKRRAPFPDLKQKKSNLQCSDEEKVKRLSRQQQVQL